MKFSDNTFRLLLLLVLGSSNVVRGDFINVTTSTAETAHLLSVLPHCGLTCLAHAVSESPCLPTDLTCSCNNDTISAQVAQCVELTCTIRESLTTKNTTDTLCQKPVRDQTHTVSYAGVIGCVIAVIAYILRMLSKVSFPCEGKVKIINNLWWDDAVITFALAEIVALSSMSVVLAEAGLGKDVWTVSFDNITKIAKIYYFDEDLYVTALPLVKISMCLTYLRIFQSRRFRHAAYVVIALNVCYAIVWLLISIFQCRPISCAWTGWDQEHECACNNVNAQGWTAAAFNVVLDIMTLSLPLPSMWKMNLNKRKKFLVMLMFSLGFFVTIVSILRLQVLVEFANTQNITWDYRRVGYWSTIELHAVVVCACMPAIRNLIRRFMPRLMGSSSAESGMTPSALSTGGTGPSVSSGRISKASRLSKLEPVVVAMRRRNSDEDRIIIPMDDMNSRAASRNMNLASDEHANSIAHSDQPPYREDGSQSGTGWYSDSNEKFGHHKAASTV